MIEVVASLALLASLLVAILAANDRLGRVHRRAQLRLNAIGEADRLLSEWTAIEPMQIPGDEGTIHGKVPLRWAVICHREKSIEGFGIQIATLKIFAEAEQDSDVALVSIDFLTTTAVAGGY